MSGYESSPTTCQIGLRLIKTGQNPDHILVPIWPKFGPEIILLLDFFEKSRRFQIWKPSTSSLYSDEKD